MSTKNIFIFLLMIFSFNFKAQTTMSSLDKGLLIGNILIQGYMAIKGNSAKAAADPNAKTVESFCFKKRWNFTL